MLGLNFPLGPEISNFSGPALNSVNRETFKRMEGGRIYHWIDFSNMHKVIVKQTELRNSSRKLAYWKLHPKDQDSMPWRAWLSSARDTRIGKIPSSSKGSIIHLNHD